MKHKIGFNRLSRKASHRKSLIRNLATVLFKYERITTTKSKAKELRKAAEKMITRAKVDSVHNRRIVAKKIFEKATLAKLFTDIAPRCRDRPGGYTRTIKIGRRNGDASEMVLIELVDREEIDRKQVSKKSKKEQPETSDTGADE